MEIKTYSDQLLSRMNVQLDTLKGEELNELSASATAISVVKQILIDLKNFVLQYKFNSPEEEIQFFKVIKPQFLGHYLFYKKLFSIQQKASFLNKQQKKKYYCHTLSKLQVVFHKYNHIYFYWLAGETHFDDRYFLRCSSIKEEINTDDRFTTTNDVTLANLIACNRLKEFLHQELIRSKNNSHTPLKWAGSKTDMVELIYALHTTGVFSQQSSDIKQIASCFESWFEINLGNYYDTFQQIRLRKINPTKFIDILKDKLLSRIENLEG